MNNRVKATSYHIQQTKIHYKKFACQLQMHEQLGCPAPDC